MTIPGSFLSAILPRTLPAVQQTARSLAEGAARAFGEWVQPSPASANGLSEPGSEAAMGSTDLPTDRGSATPSERLRAQLARWLQAVSSSFGATDFASSIASPSIAIVSDGVGIPRVEGPEGWIGPLQESLLGQPDLIDAINRVSRDQLESDPLQWMPGHEPQVRWAIPSENGPGLLDDR